MVIGGEPGGKHCGATVGQSGQILCYTRLASSRYFRSFDIHNMDSTDAELASQGLRLVHAIRHGNQAEMSAVLIEHPHAVNALVEVEGVKVELYTTTPLFEACRCGRLAVLQQLLDCELLDTNQPAVCEFQALALYLG